jgi:hypothetical protein
MRRNIRRNKVNSSQLAAFASGAGKGEVPVVNGVKGAAKKADIHASRWLLVVGRRSFAKPKTVIDRRPSAKQVDAL